jgi:hypothetical protein
LTPLPLPKIILDKGGLKGGGWRGGDTFFLFKVILSNL